MPVAAEATHCHYPRRKLEDALRRFASTHLRAQPLIPPEAKAEDVDKRRSLAAGLLRVPRVQMVVTSGDGRKTPPARPGRSRTGAGVGGPAPAQAHASRRTDQRLQRGRLAAMQRGRARRGKLAGQKRAAELRRGHERPHQLLSIDKYLEHYDDLAGDAKLRDVADFDDWTVTIPGFGDILCCPEDHRCQAHPQHPSQHTLCEHCEVPICSDCVWHLEREKVTVMEKICASPCITTLICMACPDVKNGQAGTRGDLQQPRRSRNPQAPQVEIHAWAAAMQRRAETWTFGFTLWNYLFRTMVNLQKNTFMYSVPDDNNGRRALTNQEILDLGKQIQKELAKRQYLDVNNQTKAINGDLSKVRFAVGLKPAALKAHETRKPRRRAETATKRPAWGS